MSKKIQITTDGSPPSVGTHSQAIHAGDFVFVTGQTGRNLDGALEDGLEAQSRRVFRNIEAILAAAGCDLSDIVKVTLLMERIQDFKAIDDLYAEWLPRRDEAPYPARTASGGHDLPHGAKLMLDVVAMSRQ